VAPAPHDSEHEPSHRTVQVDPVAQSTLPLAPTVTSHDELLAQLIEQDSPHVPLQSLWSAQLSVQLEPAHPELPMSHADSAGHAHEVPVHSGGGGASLLQPTAAISEPQRSIRRIEHLGMAPILRSPGSQVTDRSLHNGAAPRVGGNASCTPEGMIRTLVLGVMSLMFAACGTNQHDPTGPEGKGDMRFPIPESIHVEHAEIHGALVEATKQPGRVGEAARELAKVLDPHFVREEQIALPPLALLRPLSLGQATPEMREVLEMTDALRAELPQMLREHEAIGAQTRKLEQAARDEHNPEVEELAKKLQLHARSEEEIFYPAAILVGDLVRARTTER
jgi:hypothetical protein